MNGTINILQNIENNKSVDKQLKFGYKYEHSFIKNCTFNVKQINFKKSDYLMIIFYV